MNRPILFVMLIVGGSLALQAQVPYERIVHSGQEPQNWLTYSGNYNSQRYSTLSQITPENVKNLEVQWIYQARSLEKFEATPIVVDGIMYTVEAPNNIVALDAATGRVFWTFTHTPEQTARPCCGRVNRGLAILGDTLFMATIDARLIAVDAKNGRPLWNVAVAKPESGYAMTLAPLVVKDKVIVGTAGGEFGIRGFIAAYDAKTGKEAWRFYTIPGPGEPGHETWPANSDAWQHGGASVWVTGSYDPDLNLTYWGIGNPGPDRNGDDRTGDNLYACSVVALDADTGKVKWHYQFSPHDEFDFDSTQVPVLADMQWQGSPRKLMFWANRNGYFYVLDRATGQFLLGKPFVEVNWASGFDDKGRPQRVPGMVPTTQGTLILPGNQGGTNWYNPSFSPKTGLFYVPTWANYSSLYVKDVTPYEEGSRFTGGTARPTTPNGIRTATNNYAKDDEEYGAIRALDPHTGQMKWQFKMADVTDAGVLTTSSNLLFSGGREGYFYALDA
ncbi:MAG TPA: PQQ-dependent dehydrogenase, methanol/ethanol family, partial [Terriglobia bacterium]|nr:PQQ-dependent dehydrogenase, methanol/ethanol family [Terriglobia bacterium]